MESIKGVKTITYPLCDECGEAVMSPRDGYYCLGAICEARIVDKPEVLIRTGMYCKRCMISALTKNNIYKDPVVK